MGNKPVRRPILNEICKVRIEINIPKLGNKLFLAIDDAKNKTVRYRENKIIGRKQKTSESTLNILKLSDKLELPEERKYKTHEIEIDTTPIQGRNSRNLARFGYTRN